MSSVYEIVTERLIGALESGLVPWRRTWGSGLPRNYVSEKSYRGVNSILLGLSEFSSPYWLTYKQASALGGGILKGSKGSLITFWKVGKRIVESESGDEVEKSSAILRYYHVFNYEQTWGIPAKEVSRNEPLSTAEAIVKGYSGGPRISHHGDKAYYRPSDDSVTMPSMELFESAEAYYSVLFHELGHSTGAKHRLDREGIAFFHRFGDANYSREELVAEITSAFLRAHCGIESKGLLENSAAYLRSWLSVLRGDAKLALQAASAAQKAADWILGNRPEVS